MAKFLKLEQCPKCHDNGRDRSKDNLGRYSDGGAYCYSCGYREAPRFQLKFLTKDIPNDSEKAVLPSDFSREIPAEYWRWLLQYQLPMSYWKPYCGFTEKEARLIITYGSPVRYSVGRSLTVGASKWKSYGDKTRYVETLGAGLSDKVVLVEDIISAHKLVAAGYAAIPLFGTNIHDGIIKELRKQNRSIILWLDNDQYDRLARKINRLKSLLDLPVDFHRTEKDPKEYSTIEIQKELTNETTPTS